MLNTFSFGCLQYIRGIYFIGTIVPIKYLPMISTVGLFCCNKFEETPNEKVSNMSKLTKSYFSDRKFTFNVDVFHTQFPTLIFSVNEIFTVSRCNLPYSRNLLYFVIVSFITKIIVCLYTYIK